MRGDARAAISRPLNIPDDLQAADDAGLGAVWAALVTVTGKAGRERGCVGQPDGTGVRRSSMAHALPIVKRS